MKRLLLLLTFIGLNSWSSEYLVYVDNSAHAIKQLAQSNVEVEPVFSKKEQEILKNLGKSFEIIKVKGQDEEQLYSLLKLKFPNFKIEKNYKVELFHQKEQFESFQWALNNQGEMLEDWISDIDVLNTQGVSGEDIQIDQLENARKIKVAVIDSGLDIHHPDLKEQLYKDDLECQALEQYNLCLVTETDKNICHERFKDADANQNGYPMDCHGWNITGASNPKIDLEGSGNINDNNGHGTHVAGIIAAKKNGIGIRGVIQNVELIPVQVAVASQNNASSETATDKFGKALLYAIQTKAQVVNMSLGWRFEQDSLLMREMIKLAHEKNILIVAAAGNDKHPAPTYPCSYEEVICVGAHTVDGNISSFSNYGAHIDLLAPGTRILSTWPTQRRSRLFTIDDNYEYMSGTSQAAPFVTGLLARLLNQGLTPEAAKFALLKGARKTKQHNENFVRHGNADYQGALKVINKSFLYPLQKAPILMRWNENSQKSFKLNLKNYLSPSKNIQIRLKLLAKSSQPETSLVTTQFNIAKMNKDEVKELLVELNSPNDIDGNFLFEMQIQTADENKSYFIQAKGLSIIDENIARSDAEISDINGNHAFLKDAIIRPFRNYTDEMAIDYFATKEIDNKTHIALVKYADKQFQVTNSLPLPIKDPIIINMSKLDIDLDGKIDYVLTVVDISQGVDKRETKFFVLDESFKPKKYEVAPNNTFKNDVTVLPGGFTWLRYQQKMVPAWITMGLRPEHEREVATAWANAPAETYSNRLYLQLPSKLQTIKFDHKEHMPLHFLYQNPSKRVKGEAMLITSQGLGYFKTYQLYRFNEKLEKVQDIKLERYFDLASANPLPVANPENDDHAFFNTASTLGNHNVVAFNWNEARKQLTVNQKKALTKDKYNPISFVLSFSDQAIMSQTSSYIISQGEQITYEASQTDSRRIKHHILVGRQGLFLASDLTPGIGAELITPYAQDQSLYRPANWQTLGVNGCQEVGFILEGQKDKLVFLCAESQKLIKLSF
jgi:subtilisin family serine protease